MQINHPIQKKEVRILESRISRISRIEIQEK